MTRQFMFDELGVLPRETAAAVFDGQRDAREPSAVQRLLQLAGALHEHFVAVWCAVDDVESVIVTIGIAEFEALTEPGSKLSAKRIKITHAEVL